MRRVISAAVALLFVLSLAACKPDNIVTVPTEPEKTDTPADSTSSEEKANDSTVEAVASAEEEQLTDGARYLKNKSKNTHIRPSFDIDGKNTVKFKTPQLSGVELTFFTSEKSAFNAGSMNEKEWLSALEKEYGLKLNYKLRPDSTLYSSQRIAISAGNALDIISAEVNDCAAALSLMQSADDIVSVDASTPISENVFTKTDGRLFTAKGGCRVLWYNKALAGGNDLHKLYTENTWTAEKLFQFYNSNVTSDKRLIECDSWLSFGSAGELQASGISESGYTMSILDESVTTVFETFGNIFNKDYGTADGDFSFKAKNTVMLYSDAPGENGFEISWVPIPKCSENGKYVGELTGSAMGLSKTVSEANRGAAAAFMALWCARYYESRTDRLIYDVKLSPSLTDALMTFSEQGGGMYNADAEIVRVFKANALPIQLYGTPETVYETFGAAFARTDVINDRYQ